MRWNYIYWNQLNSNTEICQELCFLFGILKSIEKRESIIVWYVCYYFSVSILFGILRNNNYYKWNAFWYLLINDMSLFKFNDWWSVQCSTDEEFGHYSLCVSNIDNSIDGSGQFPFIHFTEHGIKSVKK